MIRLLGECDAVARFYEDRELGRAVRLLNEMAGHINDYLQEHKPWKLVQENTAQAAAVCTGALNAFKVLAILLRPILPAFGDKFYAMLNAPLTAWANLDEVLEHRTVQPYQHLVQRAERAKVDAMMSDSRAASRGI